MQHSNYNDHSSSPSLLNLPTELILTVLELVDDEDLYSLALLNNKLHHLALPIYLANQKSSRNHYLGGLKNLRISTSLSILRGLRIALFVQDLNTVNFCLPPTAQPSTSLPKTLRALTRLLLRIRHVRSIRLDFMLQCPPVDYTEEIRDLIEVLPGKSCYALQAYGWKLSARRGSREIVPLTTLKSITLSNLKVSSPSFRQWIIRSINLSPITTLSLQDIALSEDLLSFGKDLHLMTLPVLENLSIINSEVPWALKFSDIASFLCRHRGIKILKLKCDGPIPSRSPPLPVDALPLLSTIRATPHYLRHLFGPSGSLPSVVHVSVDPAFPVIIPTQDKLSRADRLLCVEDCLEKLADHASVTSLRMCFPPKPEVDMWLTMGSHPQLGKRRDVEHSLKHIRKLQLSVRLRIGESTKLLIPKWLSLFPSLELVDFDLCPGLSTPIEQRVFKRDAIATCPKLENLQFLFGGRLCIG